MEVKMNIPVKLYHGTSSIWLESLIKNGIGTRDIISEYGVVDSYRAVVSVLNKNNIPLPMATSNIAAQTNETAGTNFRHGGGLYLTASLERAKSYAIDYRFGSEIITELSDLIDLASQHDISDAVRSCVGRELLLLIDTFKNITPDIVILEFENIPEESVLSENGGDPTKVIENARELLQQSGGLKACIEDTVNFELPGVWHASNFSITTYKR